MFGLFYKDLVILKKELILFSATIFLFSLPRFLPLGKWFEEADATTELFTSENITYILIPFFVYLFVFLIISSIQSGIFAHDEKKLWNYYMISTPLGGNAQILSKYYLTFALSFLGYLWGIVCDTVSMFLTGTYVDTSAFYMSFFFIQIVLRALELPFLIGFGEKHGRTYKIILSTAIIFLAIIYRLFGRIPEFISMEACFQWIFTFFQNETALSTTMLGTVSLFPYIAVLLYYVSYKISCKLYQRGVNSDDI